MPWLAADFEGDARRFNCFVEAGADEFTDGEDRRSVFLPLVLRSLGPWRGGMTPDRMEGSYRGASGAPACMVGLLWM